MGSYAAAWYVDSPGAVALLVSRGFNAFIVPGFIPSVEATLAAIPVGSLGALNINGATFSEAVALVTRLKGTPGFHGVLPFDEPNLDGNNTGALVPVADQRALYRAIKAIDPTLIVIVDYFVYWAGVPNAEACVDNVPGQSWDVVMVDIYPRHHGDGPVVTARQFGQALRAACATFCHSSLVPILQAAWNDPGTPEQLAPLTDREMAYQYEAWEATGKLRELKAIAFYGWKSAPENHNLSNDGALLDSVAAVVAEHHTRGSA